MLWLHTAYDPLEAQARFENVAELLNTITEFAQSAEEGRATLADYLEQTALVSAVDALDDESCPQTIGFALKNNDDIREILADDDFIRSLL